MRNLVLDLIKIQQLPLSNNDIKRCIKVKDSYFILSDNSVQCVKNDNNIVIKNYVNSIEWVPVENILYMTDGQIFECFNVETEETTIIEIDGGYVVHKWNPSQDRVALVNNAAVLKIVLLDAYNATYTIIANYELDNIESNTFINVGWGSQTTQFRGSEGKYFDNKLKREDFQENIKDSSLHIAWRDDGDIFAVSFIQKGHRVFKIFSCECDFLHECEFKPGLCAELAWKPDCNLLAIESRSAKGHSIMFFEKNGLYRYDLKLLSDKYVKKIQWNMRGDILMIWQECEKNSEISLWSCTNFKWYLKQNLTYNTDNIVNYVNWNDKNCLEVITSKQIIRYSWKWATIAKYFQNNDNNYDNLGAVVVIDGNVIRVTVTSAQIIPPPYSSYNIEFNKSVNYVSFGTNDNNLAVVLDDLTVKVFELAKSSYREIFSAKLRNYEVPLSLNHFVYDDKNLILYCVESLINNHSNIIKLSLDCATKSVTSNKCYEYSGNINDLIYIYEPKSNNTYLGICSGVQVTICNLDADTQSLVSNTNLCYAEEHLTEVAGNRTVLYIINQFYTLSLYNQHLYYNGKKVANNITSYLFCPNYLLLTTTANKLLCIKLSEKGLKNLETNNLLKIYTRSIPCGAVLISYIPGTRKIILQVPRGDLEIINPRVLTIDEIDRLLMNKRHLDAYMIMQTDRINSNLFFDLNPTRFLNDIEDFIKNINNCEYLDVFLMQLQDLNISEELYQYCFEEPLPLQETENKLSTIADAFINTMKKIDVDFYLQSIITAYLCKGTDENLEKALEELSAAKTREKSGTKFRVTVNSILEHLILLTSVGKLYDIALGMDKLELIMWIASKSQLDPLEYIPFLQDLVNMESDYRNYKINCHIKRFEKAFTYLIKCDNVLDELLEFVTQHSLYRIITKYVKCENQWYKPLMKLYSKYLSNEAQYRESGLVLMRIEEFESAFNNFIKGCCLQEALTAYHLLGPNTTNINEKFIELASELINKKQYQDASYVYENLLNNYEESISILIKGTLWSHAIYLAYKNNRYDIVETDIKPEIFDYTQNLCSLLKTYKEEFVNLKTRLQKIRHEKIEQFKNGGNCENASNCIEEGNNLARNFDLLSVASTTFSRTNTHTTNSSQMTSSTLRRMKRLEKKILQIREGNAYENIAIIRRLHIIITEIQKLNQTVTDTCTQLILFPEYYDQAVNLQSTFTTLFDLINNSKEHIWPEEMLIPPNPLTIESQVYRLNVEYLDIQYRYPPTDIKKIGKRY